MGYPNVEFKVQGRTWPGSQPHDCLPYPSHRDHYRIQALSLGNPVVQVGLNPTSTSQQPSPPTPFQPPSLPHVSLCILPSQPPVIGPILAFFHCCLCVVFLGAGNTLRRKPTSG